jgi:hypothetical protein
MIKVTVPSSATKKRALNEGPQVLERRREGALQELVIREIAAPEHRLQAVGPAQADGTLMMTWVSLS